MTQVKLMGEIGKKFGTEWSSASSSVQDIIKLIDCQTEGFKEYLVDCHHKGINFSFESGEELIGEEDLCLPILKDTLIVTPVPAGSGKSIGKIIASIIMLYLLFNFGVGNPANAASDAVATEQMAAGTTEAVFSETVKGTFAKSTATATNTATTTGAITTTSQLTWQGYAVAALGVNLGLQGIAEMSMADAEDEADPSYLFNGGSNNIEQGQPVPLLYGEMKIGGTAINQGFGPGRLQEVYSNANAQNNSNNKDYSNRYGDSTATDKLVANAGFLDSGDLNSVGVS